MTKPLEYLDLELKYVQDKITLDNMHYYCFAEGKHKHKFHTEDQQLNLICDTNYLLLHNFHITRNFCYNSVERFVNLSIKKNKKLKEIDEKLEFIKQQQDLSFLKSLPKKEDIQQLLTVINQEPKKVEQKTVQLIRELETKVHRLETTTQNLLQVVQKLL